MARRRNPPPLAEMEAKTRAAVAAQSELPHVFLLRIMRGEAISQFFMDDNGQIVETQWIPSREERIDAAKAAAPYHAPKLQATRHSGPDGGAIPWREEISDNEAARRIAFTLLRGAMTQDTTD